MPSIERLRACPRRDVMLMVLVAAVSERFVHLAEVTISRSSE